MEFTIQRILVKLASNTFICPAYTTSIGDTVPIRTYNTLKELPKSELSNLSSTMFGAKQDTFERVKMDLMQELTLKGVQDNKPIELLDNFEKEVTEFFLPESYTKPIYDLLYEGKLEDSDYVTLYNLLTYPREILGLVSLPEQKMYYIYVMLGLENDVMKEELLKVLREDVKKMMEVRDEFLRLISDKRRSDK